jgi:hypothetical protein
MGLNAGVDSNSPYLKVNSVVSYLHPPLQRERGGAGKIFLLAELICICLLVYKTTNRKRERGEGEGRGKS